MRKHYKDGHSSSRRDRSSKKKRKVRSDIEACAKSDQGRSRKNSKKRKAGKHFEGVEMRPAVNKKETHKLPDSGGDSHSKERANSSLQVAMNVQEQQKAMIRHNAEIAKARLASGELQRAREEQAKMHQLYGTVDWRAKKETSD